MGFPHPSIFSAATVRGVSVRTVPLFAAAHSTEVKKPKKRRLFLCLKRILLPPPSLGLLLPLRPPIRDPIHAADGKMEGGGGGVMSKHSRNLADENGRAHDALPPSPPLSIFLCAT